MVLGVSHRGLGTQVIQKCIGLLGEGNGSISTAWLHTSLCFHHRPIKVLFSNRPKRPHLGARFPLRCFQRLSLRSVATQRMPLAEQLVHQWLPHPGPLVQRATLLKPLSPAADRDRPVSRRSEPSSRTAFIGEQPNPWELLHPQDAMSRHRGAKPRRRCERSGAISLLSPEYLLSVER